MKITITPESNSDKEVIDEIIYQAFLGHPLHPKGSLPTEHHIVKNLRDSEVLTVSLLASIDDIPCGHVALSPITINQNSKNWYGVGPLSVLPAYQKNGVGSALMKELIARAKAQGCAGLVLLGDPKYYQRFGFANNPALSYPQAPAEFFMALPFTDDVPVGVVEYHQGFYGVAKGTSLRA